QQIVLQFTLRKLILAISKTLQECGKEQQLVDSPLTLLYHQCTFKIECSNKNKSDYLKFKNTVTSELLADPLAEKKGLAIGKLISIFLASFLSSISISQLVRQFFTLDLLMQNFPLSTLLYLEFNFTASDMVNPLDQTQERKPRLEAVK
ncbi:hypothetical protein VP01_143g4, partial [Puccinia sorghi]